MLQHDVLIVGSGLAGMRAATMQVLGSAEPLESRAIGNNHAYLFSNRSSSPEARRP